MLLELGSETGYLIFMLKLFFPLLLQVAKMLQRNIVACNN